MIKISPHINFNGNAEVAFNFYKSILGGEFTKILRFKEIAIEEFPIPEHEADKIMHIELSFGNNSIIANDVPEMLGIVSELENRSKLVVHAESREEANRVFAELSEEGSVEAPIGDSRWGIYFGMFRDKFGIEWIVEFDSTKDLH